MNQVEEQMKEGRQTENKVEFVQIEEDLIFVCWNQVEKRRECMLLKLIIFPFKINGEIVRVRNNDLKIQLNRLLLQSNFQISKTSFIIKIHPENGTIFLQSSCIYHTNPQENPTFHHQHFKNLLHQYHQNINITRTFKKYITLIQNDFFLPQKDNKMQELIKLTHNSNFYAWNCLTQENLSEEQIKKGNIEQQMWSEDQQDQNVGFNFQLQRDKRYSCQSKDQQKSQINPEIQHKTKQNAYSFFYKTKRQQYNKISLVPQKMQLNYNSYIDLENNNISQAIAYFISQNQDKLLYEKYLKIYQRKNKEIQQSIGGKEIDESYDHLCYQDRYNRNKNIEIDQNKSYYGLQAQNQHQSWTNQEPHIRTNDQHNENKSKQLKLIRLSKVTYYDEQQDQIDQDSDKIMKQQQINIKAYFQLNKITISKNIRWYFIIQVIRKVYLDIIDKKINLNSFYIHNSSLRVNKSYAMKLCIRRNDIFTSFAINNKQKYVEREHSQSSNYQTNHQTENQEIDFKKQEFQQRKVASIILNFIVGMIFPKRFLTDKNIDDKIKMLNKQKFKPEAIGLWINGVENKFQQTNLILQSIILYLHYQSKMSLHGPFPDWVILISQRISQIINQLAIY